MTNDKEVAHDPMAYFETRLERDERRTVLWETLSESVFSKYVPPDGTVVELGAGWCDLINAVKARRRIAVDVWSGIERYADPAVETIVGSAVNLPGIETDSVDVVFASNLLEHLTQADTDMLLEETHRILKPEGRLVLIQPNFRLCPRRYFDDYTHVTIWTDVGLQGFLESRGWRVETVAARFLPLTVKSRFPVHPALIRAYLRVPLKPLAGQMLVVARPPVRP